MITKKQVLEAQNNWGNGVVKIGILKGNFVECEDMQTNFLILHMLLKQGRFRLSQPNVK